MNFSIKLVAVLIASTAISLAAATAGHAHGSGGHGGSNGGNTSTAQPNHGPGSSHNPIVYHPVHGPGSSHNPILATKPVVRDHRNPRPHGGGINGANSSAEGGVTVTNGRTKVPTQLGDYPVYGEHCNGLCNPGPPPQIVRDHR